MNTNEELLSRFHFLDGNTVPEKWRSFNLFLKSLRSSSDTQCDLQNFISSIIAQDSLEETFRIETMIGFNLHEPIMDELKTNNRLLMGKLLKNRKIFAEIFSNLDPQTFIEDIFPHLSYVTKLKLLHGINKNVKDEILVDKYYLAVEGGYGSKLAANLLAGCSVSFIKTKIEKFYVKLSNRELTSIFKRDKDFLLYYLKLYEKKELNNVPNWSYSKSYRKFSQMYPEMYWKVNDEYKMYVAFGRRATSMMFQHRNPIMKNDNNFMNYIKKIDRLYRAARKRGELQTFLASLFPPTHHDFIRTYNSHHMERFIMQFPPGQRYTVLSEVFKEKFGVDLLDFPDYCKICLQIIPVHLRDPIIDKLITQDESLIIFYDPSKSIPLIKKKLQHCGDADYRAKLMGWMFRSCTTNDNRQALLEALDYVWNRHKNDIIVLTVFFNNLMNLPDVTKLSEDSWQIISDINKVMEISRSQYNNSTFYSKFCTHLIEYGKSIEELCKRRLQEIMNNCDYISEYHFMMYAPKKYERMYLEEIGKQFPLFKDRKNYQIVCIGYLTQLTCFNANQGKTNPIDLNNYSALYDQIKTTDCYQSYQIISYGLKHYGSDEIWHDLFWKLPKTFRDNRILANYIQKWPQKVAENLDKVLDHFQQYYFKIFLRQAKRYLDRSALEKFKEHALNLLSRKTYEDVKYGVSILAIIAPETLLNLAETVIANTAVGRCSQNEFTQKKLMIKQLHRLGHLKDTLSLILKYCNTGSCIRYASIPLGGIAYHTAENYIKEELVKFADGPLSAKKTVLILSSFLLKSDDFAQVLQILAQKENDAAMKHAILEKISEYLQENPSEFFWNSFKTSVSSIDTNNRELYESLMNIPKIPREYLPEYIPMIFEQISANPFWEIRKKRFEFLETIPDEIIDSLDMGFLKRIIKDTACLEKVSNFHWKSIFFANHVKQSELLETNFKALHDFICENHPDLYRNRKTRNAVNNFVSRFVEVVLNLKRNGDLIEKFIVLWNTIEGSASFYQSYLDVRFTDAYFKSDFDAYKMGVEIKKMLDDYVTEIGLSVVPLFSDQLDKFLGTTGIKDRNQVSKFVQGLSEGSLDENVYALMVNLLTKNPAKIQNQIEYGATLKAMMKCEVPMVKFHMDGYLGIIGIMDI